MPMHCAGLFSYLQEKNSQIPGVKDENPC